MSLKRPSCVMRIKRFGSAAFKWPQRMRSYSKELTIGACSRETGHSVKLRAVTGSPVLYHSSRYPFAAGFEYRTLDQEVSASPFHFESECCAALCRIADHNLSRREPPFGAGNWR